MSEAKKADIAFGYAVERIAEYWAFSEDLVSREEKIKYSESLVSGDLYHVAIKAVAVKNPEAYRTVHAFVEYK